MTIKKEPGKHPRDGMTDRDSLVTAAYGDESRIAKRQAIYQYSFPKYSPEEEVLKLHGLQDQARVLDVGCGAGKLILKGAEFIPHAHWTGVDISPGMFQNAAQQAKEQELNASFLVGDVQNLPFPDRSFDQVNAMHMLYHAPDLDLAVSELARVVTQEGLVVITANTPQSRQKLGYLKKYAAEIMGREVFNDPNKRFNLENGVELVRKHFKNVVVIPFPSTIKIDAEAGAQPYVDYFDSLRSFWQPIPSDEEWEKVMKSIRAYIENEIATHGAFIDNTDFGMIVASHSALPGEVTQKAQSE